MAASLSWGCVDVTPPWQQAGWNDFDSNTPARLDAALPPRADGATIEPDTSQVIPPEPPLDAGKDQSQDSADRSEAQQDARPWSPEAQQDARPWSPETQVDTAHMPDGRPDGTADTRTTDGGDARDGMDQSPGLDAAGRDAPSADLAPDVTTPVGDAGPEALPAQGLVAHYSCESASQSKLMDESGNKRHATLASGSGDSTPVGFTFGPGKVGNGMKLNPADKAHVSLPTGIVSQLSQMTIATWVKMNSNTAFQRIFDFGASTETFMYLTNLGKTGVRFRISSSNGKNHWVETTNALPVGIWTHVTLTLGDDGISIFIDGNRGVQQAPAALRASDLGDTSSNFIGRSQFTVDPYLDASIDEFRIYDRVLSVSEIADLASGR